MSDPRKGISIVTRHFTEDDDGGACDVWQAWIDQRPRRDVHVGRSEAEAVGKLVLGDPAAFSAAITRLPG